MEELVERNDVIVIGGGAMGAATTWALARRGRRVTLLERFEPGHGRGSSHGSTRVYRLGYEHHDYIELARRALPLWRTLERDSGATLLELTGVLDHGPTEAVQPIIEAFDSHGVEHEVLDPDRAAARWPGIRFDEAVVFHSTGGRVAAQRSLDILYTLARSHGATTRFATEVIAVEQSRGTVTVRLATGEVLRADAAVVTTGAWAEKVLSGVVELPRLKVSAEQPMVFRPTHREAASWVPFVHRGVEDVYGLGLPGEGVKVSEHYRDEWLDPDDRPFDIDHAAQQRLSDYVCRWLPGLSPTPISSARCLYTTTADKDFVLDRIDRIVVGAGFSGHGLKFTPAIGELLADLTEGADQQIARWRLGHERHHVDGIK